MPQWELNGMDQLLRRMNDLGNHINGNVEKEALTEGAKVVQEAGKEKAPKRTHNLENHIVISQVKNGKIDIGPDQQGDAFYGYFLEFGRSAGTKKTGSHKGYKYPAMPPHPFMQPAFEENINKVQEEMAKVIRRGLGL